MPTSRRPGAVTSRRWNWRGKPGAQRLAGIVENNLGVVAEEERDLVGAILHFDAALAISRSLRNALLDETPLEAINLARCLLSDRQTR